MKSRTPAAIGRLAGPLLLAAAMACAGDKGGPPDSTAAAAAPAASPPWQSPVHNIEPATIAATLNNAGKWTSKPTEAERRCKGTTACDNEASPARVKVRVWAETNAMNVAFGSVGASDAILIGKIQSLGEQTTRTYNLSNKRLHAVYLVDSLGTPYYEIWDVNGQRKTRVAAGKVKECGHNREWQYSFAVFATCETSPTKHLVAGAGDSVFTWASSDAVTHDDGPIWFTCTSGCCIAEIL